MRLVLLSLMFVACTSSTDRGAGEGTATPRAESNARARQDASNRARPDYIVDSILPTDEALRRFRATIGGDSARAFSRGSRSATALIERLVQAVSRADTAELRAMALTTREFTDLYYPESPYSHPPFRQPPDLAWQLLQHPSTEGIARLLREFGGKPLAYVTHTCGQGIAREGATARRAACLVTLRDASGERPPQRYFGSILERDGQFKFLSYANRH